MEMVRMANVYMSEGNIENAYILYIKFMTLFIEKITKHPEYKSLPVVTKQPNQAKLKEVMPVTEKLKVKLMEQYKLEYSQFLAMKEMERLKDLERAKEADRARQKSKSTPDKQGSVGIIPIDTSLKPATAPDPSILDSVVYPNDFPSDNNRGNLPSSGLILPDTGDKKPLKYKNKNTIYIIYIFWMKII